MNTKLNDKLNTANVANNLTTTSAGYILDARQGKVLNDSLESKASSKSYVEFQDISINNPTYPTVSFYVNGVKKSTIFDHSGGSLIFRQENIDNNGNYSEIDLPTIINMNKKVDNLISNVSSLSSNIGKTLMYKGYITDGIMQTIDTGIFLYDGSKSTNIPVSGTGVIFSFNLDTILCYRLCITSNNGVWYSVYVPGQTYGEWAKL